jgi:hypothetical protein
MKSIKKRILKNSGKIHPHELLPSKTQSNQEMEEGELHLEKPRKSGRRSNKEVREEAVSKEKAQGKQQSIEISMNISNHRGGNKGSDLPAPDNRASSTPRNEFSLLELQGLW